MAQSEEQLKAQGDFLSEARDYANSYIKEFERQIAADVKDGKGFQSSHRIKTIKELLKKIEDMNPEDLAALPADERNKLLKATRDIHKNSVSGKKLNWDENSGRFGDARLDFEKASRDYLDSLGQGHGKDPVQKAFGEGHQAFYEQAGGMVVSGAGWVAKKNDQFWEDPGGNLKGAANATGGFIKYVGQNFPRSVTLFKRGVAEGLGSGAGMILDAGRWAGRHTLNSYTYMTDQEPWLAKPKGHDGEPPSIGGFFARNIGFVYTKMGVGPPENGYERGILSTGKAVGEVGGVIVGSVFTGGAVGFAWGAGRATGSIAIRTAQAMAMARTTATATATLGAATAPENVTSSLTLGSIRETFAYVAKSGIEGGIKAAKPIKRMTNPYTFRSQEAKFMPGRTQEAKELATGRLKNAAAHESKLAAAGDNATRASANLARANYTGDVFGQFTAHLGEISAKWGQTWHNSRMGRLLRIAENSLKTSERFNVDALAHQALQYGRVAKPESGFFTSLTKGNLDPLRNLYHGFRATDKGGRVFGWAGGLEVVGGIASFTMGYLELDKKATAEKEEKKLKADVEDAREKAGDDVTDAYDDDPEDHSSLGSPNMNAAFTNESSPQASGLSHHINNRFTGLSTPLEFALPVSSASEGITPKVTSPTQKG